MSSHKNTITINGKIYDIHSGKVVNDSNIATPINTSVIAPNNPAARKQSIDGFNKPVKRVAKATVNPTKRHKDKTHTLARNYVQRPKKTNEIKSRDKFKVNLHQTTDEQRLNRAKTISKSHKVSKFGYGNIDSVVKKIDRIDVVPAPKTKKTPYDIDDIPPAPRVDQSVKKTKATDIFETAMAASVSHKQTYKPERSTKKRKIASFSALALTVILLGGFFFYQNINKISLSSVSNKAGFTASMPSYNPSGFGLDGSIKYQAGKVVLDFRSKSDERNYTIEQTKSDLNSTALANEILLSENREYQTEYINGRTVYIYDNSKATWVDGGVQFTLSDNANLTKDQVLKIVSSI